MYVLGLRNLRAWLVPLVFYALVRVSPAHADDENCAVAITKDELEACLADRPLLTGNVTGGFGFDSNGTGGGTFTGRIDITRVRPIWLGVRVRMLANSQLDGYAGWVISHDRTSGWHTDSTAVYADSARTKIYVDKSGQSIQSGGDTVIRTTTTVVGGVRSINVLPTGIETNIPRQAMALVGVQHHIKTHQHSHKIFEAYVLKGDNGWGSSVSLLWSTLALGRFVAGAEIGLMPTMPDKTLYIGIDLGAAFEL